MLEFRKTKSALSRAMYLDDEFAGLITVTAGRGVVVLIPGVLWRGHETHPQGEMAASGFKSMQEAEDFASGLPRALLLRGVEFCKEKNLPEEKWLESR